MPKEVRSGLIAVTLLLPVLAAGCAGDSVTAGSDNQPPELEAVRDTTVALGDTLGVFVSATDADGDDITYHLAVSVTWEELKQGYRADASLDARSGYFWFRPSDDDIPSRDFQFTADDGRGGEDAAWMKVGVTGLCMRAE